MDFLICWFGVLRERSSKREKPIVGFVHAQAYQPAAHSTMPCQIKQKKIRRNSSERTKVKKITINCVFFHTVSCSRSVSLYLSLPLSFSPFGLGSRDSKVNSMNKLHEIQFEIIQCVIRLWANVLLCVCVSGERLPPRYLYMIFYILGKRRWASGLGNSLHLKSVQCYYCVTVDTQIQQTLHNNGQTYNTKRKYPYLCE